ncbi:zinc finger protein 862-like [Mytilus galloprovincialis]|uniref:zinc finger protein 862-like n=1 Tax=Mytilus galloprovincialis TaxID=29158 RepID=UPI003F7C4A36
MEKENEDKIKKLITTAYFICKHEKPFTDFQRLIELQEVNGLDMGNFYRSDNACRRVLLAHFEHIRESRSGSAEVQGRATFISKKLKHYKFLYIVFFFLDILKVLSVLSLKFQQDYLTLSAMFDAISTANLSLIELKTVNGKELTNVLATVDSQNSTYKDIQLSNMSIDEDSTRQKQVIVDLIVATLDNRFEPMEKDPVLKAASLILSFSEWPQDRNDLATYKNEEMAYLLENFHEILERNGCNLDAIMDQNGKWKDFKAYIGRHKATVAVENFFIYPDLKRRFFNMILVLELLLSFPLSSAVCERGFFAMKRVKTDWRSSLKPEMLIILLFITVEGPELNHFETNSVFNHWWSSGRQKRPGFNSHEFIGLRALPDPDMEQTHSDDDIDDN